jgi:hypothetical protein
MYSHRSCHVSVFRPLCPLESFNFLRFFKFFWHLYLSCSNSHLARKLRPPILKMLTAMVSFRSLPITYVLTSRPSVAQLAIVLNRPASRPLRFANPNGETMLNGKSLTASAELFVSNAVFSWSSPYLSIYRDDTTSHNADGGAYKFPPLAVPSLLPSTLRLASLPLPFRRRPSTKNPAPHQIAGQEGRESGRKVSVGVKTALARRFPR